MKYLITVGKRFDLINKNLLLFDKRKKKKSRLNSFPVFCSLSFIDANSEK